MRIHRLIPPYIEQQARAGQTAGGLSGVLLFVDVSGFSTITDALMQHGRYGAEVLAKVVRAVFEPMMGAVYAQGGFVISQEGDSFSALFVYEEANPTPARQALAAALRILQEAALHGQQPTEFGEFTLQVRVGLSAGEVFWAIANSTDAKRAAFYFYGPPVDASAEAQKHAPLNTIAFDDALLRELDGQGRVEDAGGFFVLREPPPGLPEPRAVCLPDLDLDVAERFYPRELYTAAVSDEFRQVVNLFVSLPTIRTAAQLAIFMQSLFVLQDRYGGVLSRVGFGDKGPHLLLFWGAPAAFENDVQRALQFILDLQTQTAIPINCGITYRIAHTGFIGSAYAEDYAPFGRGVNLAARFVSQAPRGEIWVDEFVAARAGSRFDLESSGERQFKGFSAPQKVFILGERKDEETAARRGAWVGRQNELEGMAEFTRALFNARAAGALILWGEPGIGKSSLAREFVRRQQEADPGVANFSAPCDEILRQPLNPFRYWLRHYLQVSEAQVEARNKRSFNRAVDQLIAATADTQLADELDRTRSFLGALVDLSWPDSLYEQMDAKGRYENTFLAITALLRAENQRRPLIFLLEDAHWLDEDSRALLLRLMRSLNGPVLFCITARSTGTAFDLGGAPSREVQLDRLNLAELARLAASALGGEAGPTLLDLLDQRAEGNPYFAEQFLAFVSEEGLLERTGSGWELRVQDESELPVDVGSLLVARLDRLTLEVKEVVQTASVLGREFESQILSAMLAGDPKLGERLARATDERIWHKLNEMRYIFQHALLREAAYQMQILQRRKALHAVAFAALRGIFGAEASEHYGEYAYHARQAGMRSDALEYSRRAGWAALDAYQNRLAEEHFSVALALDPLLPLDQRFDLLLGRLTALERIGLLERRIQDLTELERIAGLLQDVEKTAEVLLHKASYFNLTGAYSDAERIALQVLALNLDAQSVHAYKYLAEMALRTSQLERSIGYAEAGIVQAEKIQDRRSVGTMHNLMGLAMAEQLDLQGARLAFERSLAVARESGRFFDEAPAFGNLGMLEGMVGNYPEALANYEKSLVSMRKAGDREHEGLALGNLGWIAGILGAYEQADAYCRQFLRISREVGNVNGQTNSLINLSAYAVARRDFAAASEHARQALDLTSRTGDRSSAAWALTYLGHGALDAGDVQSAVDWYRQALAIRDDLKQAALGAEPLGGLALALLRSGSPADALRYAEQVLPRLEAGELDATDEPQRVYLNIYQVLNGLNDARAGHILAKSIAYMQARAAGIKDELARQTFFNIRSHRELLQAWEMSQSAGLDA